MTDERRRLYVPDGAENGPPKDDYKRRLIGYVVDRPVADELNLEIVTFSAKEASDTSSDSEDYPATYLTPAKRRRRR